MYDHTEDYLGVHLWLMITEKANGSRKGTTLL